MGGTLGFHAEEFRMTAAASTPPTADERRDALVERLFMAAVGAMDVLGVYVGERLGLYSALAERGPSTSQELAGVLGLSERYVREWLEQQAAGGILELDAGSGNDAQRR
jgi:hypothetical protein